MNILRRLHLLCLLAVTLAIVPTMARDGAAGHTRTVPGPADSAPLEYASGTVIVKLKQTTWNNRGSVNFKVSRLDAVLDRIGATDRQPLFPMAPYVASQPQGTVGGASEQSEFGFDRVYVVRYGGPYDAAWVADQLSATGLTEYAEPYYFFRQDAIPNDPLAAQEYWLGIIKAQQAWDITQGDSTVFIAICDSGVDWRHEDLTDNIWVNPGEIGKDLQGRDKRTNGVDDDENNYDDDWHGWDFVGNASFVEQQSSYWRPDNDPAPRAVGIQGYTGYHGTTVAGCASARTNNGKGISSPGYKCKILAIKCAADSNISSVNAGYEGIRYAADMGAKVINCSFGGSVPPGTNLQAMQSVMDYAWTKGSLVVAASGNEGSNLEASPSVPGVLNHVLTVGATSRTDFADTSYTNCGTAVDVYAPGTNILTTSPGSQYVSSGVTGTSFSSPVVAGIAGLVFSVHPNWTPDQVAMQLRVTGDRVQPSAIRFAPQYYRRANAFRAVSINRILDDGNPENLPGLSLVSYKLNGRTRDTLRGIGETMKIQLTLKNHLAPTRNLKISAYSNQMLVARTPTSVPTVATGATATTELELTVDTTSPEIFADGNISIVLRLVDGAFEDLITLSIPVRLNGWRQQTMSGASTAYSPASIAAVSPTVAWAVSNTVGLAPFASRLTNGKNWSSYKAITAAAEPVYCVAAIDVDRAWAGASPSTTGAASIYRTTNGGGVWQPVSVSTITPFVNAIHFFDAANGIFIGDPKNGRWGIGTTTDGGATWRAIAKPLTAGSATEAGWNNSFSARGDTLWFGTNNNRIYQSTDRGATWRSIATPGKSSFSVAFTDRLNGIVVFKQTTRNNLVEGAYGVSATSDGGATWRPITLPGGALADVANVAPGTNRIVMATDYGILETNDVGTTWKGMPAPLAVFGWKQTVVSARLPLGISLSGTTDTSQKTLTLYGTSSRGQMITYTETAPAVEPPDPISGIRDESMASGAIATLEQNLPNPTSGTTTIGFNLRSTGEVALSLFDVTGSAIRTLASGNMSVGHHAVTLDVSTLAAGTYYYTLEVGGERVTRRMVVR